MQQTKSQAPHPYEVTFGGKTYYLLNFFSSKSEAEAEARRFRAGGGSARVVSVSQKGVKHFGQSGYLVYAREKHW